MVVSFSEEQPTIIYKYDISKSTSQCNKEADIITASVYEQLKLLDNFNSKKKRGPKKIIRCSPIIDAGIEKNKKLGLGLYSDVDENTSNTSPTCGKYSPNNNTNLSTESSTMLSTSPHASQRGSKKEQTLIESKKKKKRNMLDSDSSSEEEVPLTKESFGILQLKKRVRIDREKKKRAATTAATATEQSKIEQHQMEVEQQTVDAGELNVHVLDDVATRDDDVNQEADHMSHSAAAVTLSVVDKEASARLPSLAVQADASSLVSAAAVDLESIYTTDCGGDGDKESRGVEESAVTADQLTIQDKEPTVPPVKEDDYMEVEVVEDQQVKSCYSPIKDGGVDRKRSPNNTMQERVESDAVVTIVKDISRHSINDTKQDDEKSKRISKSGGSDSSALLIDLTSSGDEDESPTTSQVWICGACTLENTNPLAQNCEVCAVSREESEKWKSAQWACPTCTLLNDNRTSVCDACNYNRGDKVPAQSKPRKKIRSAGDSERERQLAMWEEDRASSNMKNKKRTRHSFPGAAMSSASSSNYNSIDLQGLAAARHERQSLKIKPHHTAGGGDDTWMPGEFGLSGTVRYWDLTQSSMSSSRHAQAKGGLCGAGHRHLSIIMKTLNKRTPSVTLKRVQYLVNPTLLRKFEALKARLSGSHNVVYLFHGTGEQNIDSIATKGFLTRHAASGPGLIWFSRQSTYSYGFTTSVPGKGLSSSSGASSSSSWGARGSMSGMMMPDPGSIMPSGRMFICALLVARSSSETSNVGDKGQDVITMTKEVACLPMYLIDTTTDSPTSFPGGLALPGFGQTSRSFQGRGNTGGRKLE